MRVLAVIPARGGSKGLPRKNILPFCGKPLIAWTIETAFGCRSVDRVIVSTDSEEIAVAAKEHGAPVPFMRPAELAGDAASSVDVALHAIDSLSEEGEAYDIVVLLEPTSPLRDVGDVERALGMIAAGGVESVVGVVQVESSHPSFLFVVENGLLAPVSDSGPTGIRRQDLDNDFYYPEGSVYVTAIGSLRKNRSFYPAATAPLILERYKAVEVDELCDFIAAEALMTAKLAGVI